MDTFLASPLADQLANLTLSVGATGPLHNPDLHLSSTNITPDKNSKLTDFTESLWTGYLKAAITWGAPYIDPLSGAAWVVSLGATFIATGAPTAETVYTFYLTDSTDAVYHGGGQVLPPVPITVAGDGLTVQVVFPYGG